MKISNKRVVINMETFIPEIHADIVISYQTLQEDRFFLGTEFYAIIGKELTEQLEK